MVLLERIDEWMGGGGQQLVSEDVAEEDEGAPNLTEPGHWQRQKHWQSTEVSLSVGETGEER